METQTPKKERNYEEWSKISIPHEFNITIKKFENFYSLIAITSNGIKK